jgi:tryptophanase
MDLGPPARRHRKGRPGNVSFVRMEATTNLIGGQPFSLENLRR